MAKRSLARGSSQDLKTAYETENFYGVCQDMKFTNEPGRIASLIKRVKKFDLSEDCRHLCKNMDKYKALADKVHQAIIGSVLEPPRTAKSLERPYQAPQAEEDYYSAQFYFNEYTKQLKEGRPGEYTRLEEISKVLEALHVEQVRYVKKCNDILKPLTTFIAEDYWGYVKIRKAYMDSMVDVDTAVTAHNKERSVETESNLHKAEETRNNYKKELIDYIKAKEAEQVKHAECVNKFMDETSLHHAKMAEILQKFATE